MEWLIMYAAWEQEKHGTQKRQVALEALYFSDKWRDYIPLVGWERSKIGTEEI